MQQMQGLKEKNKQLLREEEVLKKKTVQIKRWETLEWARYLLNLKIENKNPLKTPNFQKN